MEDDARCCGSGHCVIDAQGKCWCGQQWDGTQMCRPVPDMPSALLEPSPPAVPHTAQKRSDSST